MAFEISLLTVTSNMNAKVLCGDLCDFYGIAKCRL